MCVFFPALIHQYTALTWSTSHGFRRRTLMTQSDSRALWGTKFSREYTAAQQPTIHHFTASSWACLVLLFLGAINYHPGCPYIPLKIKQLLLCQNIHCVTKSIRTSHHDSGCLKDRVKCEGHLIGLNLAMFIQPWGTKWVGWHSLSPPVHHMQHRPPKKIKSCCYTEIQEAQTMLCAYLFPHTCTKLQIFQYNGDPNN